MDTLPSAKPNAQPPDAQQPPAAKDEVGHPKSWPVDAKPTDTSTPAEPPDAGEARAPGQSETLDQFVAVKLQEIESAWGTDQLESFLNSFFQHVADRHASEVAVTEVIQKLHQTLKAKRGTAPTLAKLRKMYNLVAATPRLKACTPGTIEGEDVVRVQDCMPDAPVGPEVVMPSGWDMDTHGVVRLVGQGQKAVLPAPFVIAGRLTNIADGTEALRLAWQRDGAWREHVVDRVVVANSKDIVKLAGVGAPVTSNNAADVVQYLADFEATNLAHLPRDRVSSQMGWSNDMTTFLWGRTLIQTQTLLPGEEIEDHPAVSATDQPHDDIGNEGKILFRGADTGDDQLADGFHSAGTFADWRAAVLPMLVYSRVRLAMAASLSAPFLVILDLANYGVDLCGETSRGKTTTLQIAASIWGRPDEKAPNAAMSAWNSTRVWRERASIVLNNLPVILDETKLVKHKPDIGEFLSLLSG